jgi:hypothetical protein
MTDFALRPRSATEIVDAAFQLYRRDAALYLLLTGLAYAPWLVIRLIALGAGGGQAEDTSAALLPTGLELVATIGEFVVFSLMTAVVIRLGADAYHGRPLNAAAAIRDVLPRVPAVIVASLITFLLMVVGFVFLIIPALYVVAAFFAATQVIVLEGRDAFAGLRRSAQLSKGRKLHILGTFALVIVIFVIVGMGVVLLVEMAGSRVLSTVFETLYTVVGYPLLGLCTMVLYYDARIRAEGYDVEVMAGTLGPAHARP